MNAHCRGCRAHHNAGHPKGSPRAHRYNDWCCRYGKTARDAIGHCKLNGGKQA